MKVSQFGAHKGIGLHSWIIHCHTRSSVLRAAESKSLRESMACLIVQMEKEKVLKNWLLKIAPD